MGSWDFVKMADGGWQWRHLSDHTGAAVCSGRFPTRNDCIADAMRHGYLTENGMRSADTDAADCAHEVSASAAFSPFLHRLLHR